LIIPAARLTVEALVDTGAEDAGVVESEVGEREAGFRESVPMYVGM
jgi:hypothetical protein